MKTLVFLLGSLLCAAALFFLLTVNYSQERLRNFFIHIPDKVANSYDSLHANLPLFALLPPLGKPSCLASNLSGVSYYNQSKEWLEPSSPEMAYGTIYDAHKPTEIYCNNKFTLTPNGKFILTRNYQTGLTLLPIDGVFTIAIQNHLQLETKIGALALISSPKTIISVSMTQNEMLIQSRRGTPDIVFEPNYTSSNFKIRLLNIITDRENFSLIVGEQKELMKKNEPLLLDSYGKILYGN